MSWSVHLVDKDSNSLEVPSHEEGGIYALGGIDKAELSVTYNYSKYYHNTINSKEGLNYINDKKAEDVIGILESAVDTLGIEKDDNYWKETSGNAGYALSILCSWAKQHPKGIFTVN